MPFPSAVTTATKEAIRAGGFAADQYMLIWSNPIVFQAQINQASFASSFATITYDNVTVGAYTDILSDFTCYVGSSAGDIINASHRFRIRANGSGTVATTTAIYINETSAALTDDLYIMVVKDVRVTAKQPRTIQAADPANYTYPRDYEITFRRLLSSVYGLQCVYAKTLNSSGVADFVLAPSALLADDNATTISTWAWNSDGLAFQAGSSSTQNVTLRASAAGQYMPRVTVTDDVGNSFYFTFKVFVAPADYSSVINLAFGAATIPADTTNWQDVTILADRASNDDLIYRVNNLADETFCALWYPGDNPLLTSDILFAGRFSQESVNNNFSADGNTLLSTQFKVDGLATQLRQVISRRMAILDKTAPAVFGEIEKLTPWRAAHYFITEHTTLANVASVQYLDVTENYRYPRFATGDSSALASIQDLLFTINAAINIAPTWEIEVDRMAWYLADAARNALTTVAGFTMSDVAVMETGGQPVNVQRAYIKPIGRELSGGGVYNTTSGNVQILRATTPAVVQSEGIELATLNRQVLITNSTLSAASTELGQRTADDTAARQPQTILRVAMPAAYVQLVYPHQSRWYTWTIAATDNNRGIAYTSATRWTCRYASLTYSMEYGDFILNADFQLETQGSGYQTLITTPLESGVNYYNPVVPIAPVYANFPEEPNSELADPSAPTQEDAPPFSQEDVAIVNSPNDPATTAAAISGSYPDVALIWQSDKAWKVIGLTSGNPYFYDVTPLLSGFSIEHGRLDHYSETAYILSSSATDAQFLRDPVFGERNWTGQNLSNPFKLIINQGIGKDKLYLYCPETIGGADPWTWTFDFTAESGSDANTTYGQENWTPINTNMGVYVSGTGWVASSYSGASEQRGITIGRDIAAATITSIQVTYDWTKGYFDNPTANPGIDSYFAAGTDTKYTYASALPASDTDRTTTHTHTAVGQTSVRSEVICDTWTGGGGPRSGQCTIKSITLVGTGDNPFSAAGEAGTRYSSDNGVTWENLVSAGTSAASEAGASMIAYSPTSRVGVAIDEDIRQASAGGAFSDEASSHTTSTYALAMTNWDLIGDNNFLFATAASWGGEYLHLVEDGVRTTITPNDGVDLGIPINSKCLWIGADDPYPIFGLFSFGGTIKFAYNRAEGGDTWLFDTTVTANANYLWVKTVNGLYHIFVCDYTVVKYATWDADNANPITFRSIPTPAELEGIAFR